MKNSISITEYIFGKIICPYHIGRDANESKYYPAIEYDLSKPDERGKYFHDYIAKHYNNSLQFKKQYSSVNEDADKAIEWTNTIIKENEAVSEELITGCVFPDGVEWDITGRPDIYSLNNNKLTIIDYKYFNKPEDEEQLQKSIRQLYWYMLILTDQNFSGKKAYDINIYIYFKDEIYHETITKKQYEEIREREVAEVTEYLRNARRHPSDKCISCGQDEMCNTMALFGAIKIIKAYANATNLADTIDKRAINNLFLKVSKEDTELDDNDFMKMATLLIHTGNEAKKLAEKKVPKKKKGQFVCTPDALYAYLQKCKEEDIEPVIKERCDLVTSSEFRRVMGEEEWEKYKVESSENIYTRIQRYNEETEAGNNE